MCGIGALFRYNEYTSAIEPLVVLSAVNQVQRRRGPDGEGIWVSEDGRVGLGHRRLAIIDLSPAGAQPLASADGKLRITFNGEIYNYQELRYELERKGCTFFSASDTEVILNLYRIEGPDCVHRLRGMYAFAIWDEQRQGLFLARDPFGIKPLYYADDGKTFMAASQVKALLAAGGVDTSPEPAGHVGFFLWGYVPEPYTLYKGIRALPAGSTLWVDRGGDHPARPKTFCDVAQVIARRAPSSRATSEKDFTGAFGEALRDSVKHHMVSDVPVGVFLSAGLDSTSVAGLAAGISGGPLRTFTLGFEEYRGTENDETPLAEMVARQVGARHKTEWVRGKDFSRDMENIVRAMDQPTIDGVNTYFVSKLAAKSGLKVALSGLGGDELLGGYPSFRHIPMIMKIAKALHPFGKAFRLVSEPVIPRFTSPKYAGVFEYGKSLGGAYLLRRGLFMPWELPKILDADMVREGWRQLAPVARIDGAIPQGTTPFSAISAIESTWYMRNMLLRDSDWAAMAHSLEIRVPLVDIELVRKLAPLMQQKFKPDKKIMAKAAWQNDPPKAILERSKTGFSVPVRQWLMGGAGSGERGHRSWAKLIYSVFEDSPNPCISRCR